MLFIMTQQVQPDCIMVLMHSQQAWIMAAQSLSPLVQVMTTPSLVISHLHMPIVMLQQHTIMPFIMQQQEHMVPAMAAQRFCRVLAATLSGQTQVIFMPPVHFSILMVQRGTIGMVIAGMPPGMVVMPGVIMPGMPVIVGLIIAFIMIRLLLSGWPPCRGGFSPPPKIPTSRAQTINFSLF
jgi:hypothetical protein